MVAAEILLVGSFLMQVTLTANIQLADIDPISETIWNLGFTMTQQFPDWPLQMTLKTATGWWRRQKELTMLMLTAVNIWRSSGFMHCPHRWARHIHTADLISMDLVHRPYGTEINNVQNETIYYFQLLSDTHMHADTLTCGDRAVGGWVKSVEWAADRRPCALLTVWRVKGADSTSCWRKDTNRHWCQVGEHRHQLKVETKCLG